MRQFLQSHLQIYFCVVSLLHLTGRFGHENHYQRPDCVIRSIAYWAYKSVKIIIVDGSAKPIDKYFRDEIFED